MKKLVGVLMLLFLYPVGHEIVGWATNILSGISPFLVLIAVIVAIYVAISELNSFKHSP